MTCWPLPYVDNILEIDSKYSESINYEKNDIVFENLQRAREKAGTQKMKIGDLLWRRCIDEMEDALPKKENIISRAYHKLIEILNVCVINIPKNALMLCEAPGGFCQALTDISNDKCNITVTSKMDNESLKFPKCLELHESVTISVPQDGDILKSEVRKAIAKICPPKGYELITGDGAYNNDFRHNDLESSSANLFASQLQCALQSQAHGGVLILKFFSGFLPITQQLIFLASSLYKETYIVKPQSSRSVNDERYLVCKFFLSEKYKPFEIEDNKMLVNILSSQNNGQMSIERIIRQLAMNQIKCIHEVIELTEEKKKANGKGKGKGARTSSFFEREKPYGKGQGIGKGTRVYHK